jgi:hypothetical protein
MEQMYPNLATTITEEEYNFIGFANLFDPQPNGLVILRRWGLRNGKRVVRSLVKKGVLMWNEEDSNDGCFTPILWGVNYHIAIRNYLKQR